MNDYKKPKTVEKAGDDCPVGTVATEKNLPGKSKSPSQRPSLSSIVMNPSENSHTQEPVKCYLQNESPGLQNIAGHSMVRNESESRLTGAGQ